MKVKNSGYFGYFDWLTDIGGFGKAIGYVGALFSACLLRRRMDEEMSFLDSDYKNIVSYERIIEMSK